MVRQFATFISCTLALLNLLQAPFLHTHKYSDAYAQGGPFHTHLLHHHSDTSQGPSIGAVDPDDDAQLLNGTPPLQTSAMKMFVAIGFSVLTVPQITIALAGPTITPRAHDPPLPLNASPRAPPA